MTMSIISDNMVMSVSSMVLCPCRVAEERFAHEWLDADWKIAIAVEDVEDDNEHN